MEKYVNCPACHPDNIYSDNLISNTHIVRTFVTGPNDFAEKTPIMYELDGNSVKGIPYHDLISLNTQRGSTIDILLQGESCSHFFIKRIYFHKGDVMELIIPMPDMKSFTDDKLMKRS